MSAENITPHIFIVPENVHIAVGNVVLIAGYQRSWLGTIPVNRYFQLDKTVKGSDDTIYRGTLGHYQRLRHEEGEGLVVHIPGKHEEHHLGYVIGRDDTQLLTDRLATATYDAANGEKTLDWSTLLLVNHVNVTRGLRKAVTGALDEQGDSGS